MSKFSFEPDKYKHGNIAVTHKTSSNLSTTIRLTQGELHELITEGQKFLDGYEPPKQIAEGSEVMILAGAQSYSHAEKRRVNVDGDVVGYQGEIVEPIDSDGDYFIRMLTGPERGGAYWIGAEFVQETES